MRPNTLKLVLFALCLAVLHTSAQTCTGSLGDPVINEDFGAGPNPGSALANSITDMNYVPGGCPDDGSYSIVNSENLQNSCHPTWHTLTQDHTGNVNGYMMVVNASKLPSIFYTQTAPGNKLCPNTQYEFAAWIANLITPEASGPDVIEPDITFTVTTVDGRLLAPPYHTGAIKAAPYEKMWGHYGTFFTTPSDGADIIVTMTNNAAGGNGNDLILDDITFRACGPIIQTGFGSPTASTNQDLCEGGTANYTIKTSVSDPNPYFQWQYNPNGTGWADIPGKTSSFLDIGFKNAQPGNYQYRVAVGDVSNISSLNCRVYSAPATVSVSPLPVVPLIAAQTVCESNTLQLTASGGATYQWSGPNLPPTAQNPLVISNVTSSNAGTYSVVVTSASGCPAPPVNAQVKVVPKVIASVSKNVTICAGDATTLSASGGLYYKWIPATGLGHDDSPNPVANPTQTTTYSVNVSNEGCYDDTKSVTVTVLNPPTADAGPTKKIFEGQSVKLNGLIGGDDITSVYWSPTTYLDDPASAVPKATPTDDITYTLNVVSKTCGMASSSVFVRVYKKIVIPNTFSPNNDGVNDNWNIEALVTYPESLTIVYNRLGQEVYKTTGYSKPWNGTFNGKELPEGTYYYVIDLKNNTPKISGWVFIVR